MQLHRYQPTCWSSLAIVLTALLVLAVLPHDAQAQAKQDCPMIEAGECFDLEAAQAASKRINHQPLRESQAFGDFLGSFGIPGLDGGDLAVGLDGDGGDLYNTEIVSDDVIVHTTAGGFISTCSTVANSVGTLGIAKVGGTLYITDAVALEVDVYDTSCNFQSSFTVSGQTTFPEGIDYSPLTGNLYVVNGSGGNAIHEYTTSGSLVTSYPVGGSSQDGLAYHESTCSFFMYDSGTDTVRQFDPDFNEITTFPGTAANGLGNGEGLAVIDDNLYVTATGMASIGVFDIAGAAQFCPDADLGIYKDQEINESSKTGSYHITVTNYGPADADDIEVTESLPGALLVTGWSESQGTFDPFSGLWAVGSLAIGESAELWIDVSFQASGRYTNRVDITNSSKDDPDGSNNYDEVSVVFVGDRVVPDFVPGQSAGGIVERGSRFTADLVLGKTVDVETADVGQTVTYTIDVTNLGPQSTAKVEATDNLPECLTFVSASASKGSFNETTGVWSIGAMKVDELATLTIEAEVGATCSGTVTNTAYISSSSLPDPSDFFNLFDEPPATIQNNSDEASIGINGRELVLDGTTFALGTNYPNPFNPTTRIPFSLAESGQVSVRVYDLLGREVSVLVDGSLSAGVHEVEFEGSALPTGMYIVRMEAAGVVKTMRMTLMK